MQKQSIENEEVNDPSKSGIESYSLSQVQGYAFKVRTGACKPADFIKDKYERWACTLAGIKQNIPEWKEFFLAEFGNRIKARVWLNGYYAGVNQEDVYQEAQLEVLNFLFTKTDIRIETLPGLVKTHTYNWFNDFCRHQNSLAGITLKYKKKKGKTIKDEVAEETPPQGEFQAWPDKKAQLRLEDDSTPGPETKLHKYSFPVIHKIVQTLSQEGQVIIRGFYRYGLTDQEIGELLKRPRATVQRMRIRLEKQLLLKFIKAGIQPDM